MPDLDVRAVLNRPDCKIALIGATNDSTKYGNIIMRDLLAKGYTVFPVNSRAKSVAGITAYPDLEALLAAHGPMDIYNFVIPPAITLQVAEWAIAAGLDNFWFQPGAENAAVLAACEAANRHYIAHACVMVMARNKSA